MNSPIKILVIEDSPADFLLLERHVQQHGMTAEFRCVNSDVELDAALQSDWDIVLSDYNVPSMDFRGTLRRIQEKRPNLPIILVSGTIGDEVAVELLHLGLSDFVLKDRLALNEIIIEKEMHKNLNSQLLTLSNFNWKSN